jgi:hypothetical protein
VILVDAGPLVALVDADDQFHKKCVATLKVLREPLSIHVRCSEACSGRRQGTRPTAT